MTRNSRELSQFASFIDIKDANQNIGLQTSMVFETGGVGIGSDVSGYLSEAQTRGAEDPLIVYNKSFFLDNVQIDGDLNVDGGSSGSVSGTGATFPGPVNVGGLTTTKDLVVTGIATLGRDTGMGRVYIGMGAVNVEGADDEMQSLRDGIGTYRPKNYGLGGREDVYETDDIVQATLVVDSSDQVTQSGVGTLTGKNELALFVSGRSHFTGLTNPAESSNPNFVVTTPALFTEPIDVYNKVIISESGNADNSVRLEVLSSDNEADRDSGIGSLGYPAAIYTDGGIEAAAYGRIGYGLSVGEWIEVGQQLGIATDPNADHKNIPVQSKFYGDVNFEGLTVAFGSSARELDLNLLEARIDGLIPQTNAVENGIGTENARWKGLFCQDADFGPPLSPSQVNMVNLDVGLGATMGFLDIGGAGADDDTEVYLTVKPGRSELSDMTANDANFAGIVTVRGQLILNTPIDVVNEGYITTARRAQNVDVTKQDVNNSIDPEFYYPAMANAGISQTAQGAQMFVNPGFYLDTFSTSLYVHNNLNVLGTAINATEEEVDLRFDLVNYGITELNLASSAKFIDIGQDNTDGMTSIRSNVTEVKRLQLAEDFIQASTGSTNITLEADIKTQFAGFVQIGGTYIQVDSNVINIADQSQQCDLFTKGTDILVGGQGVGIITFRNTILESGFLRLRENVIYSDDDVTAIEVGSGGTFVQTSGKLIVGGKVIQTGFGITNITMVDDTKTIFEGDIAIKGNNIQSEDQQVAITLSNAQEQVSVTGALRVEGDHIRAGTGATNIFLNDTQFTRFAGAIQVDGNVIRSSDGQDNITLDSDVRTTVTGDLQVGTGTMRAGDGVIAIKMVEGTGDVGITSDLTANSLFINGLEARLNAQDLNIRDNLITLGLIEDPLNEGELIPPNVGLGNSGDVGFLLARYDVGLATHKYAGIFYDESAGRVAIRTDVQDAGGGEVGRDRKLQLNGTPSELEVSNLLVNINTTLGIKTIFEAGTVDTGEEDDVDVLNIVNVEIDAGIYA